MLERGGIFTPPEGCQEGRGAHIGQTPRPSLPVTSLHVLLPMTRTPPPRPHRPYPVARAYAPGGIGNLGPGLDVLGCAVTGAEPALSARRPSRTEKRTPRQAVAFVGLARAVAYEVQPIFAGFPRALHS